MVLPNWNFQYITLKFSIKSIYSHKNLQKLPVKETYSSSHPTNFRNSTFTTVAAIVKKADPPPGHEHCGLRYLKDEMFEPVAVQNKQDASFQEIHLPSRPVMIRACAQPPNQKKLICICRRFLLKELFPCKIFEFLTKYFEKVVHQ